MPDSSFAVSLILSKDSLSPQCDDCARQRAVIEKSDTDRDGSKRPLKKITILRARIAKSTLLNLPIKSIKNVGDYPARKIKKIFFQK